jgi:RNA polymerase-binding transcription factor DksA
MEHKLAMRDVEHYEHRLRALHRRLLGDLAGLEVEALGSAEVPIDAQGDDGTQAQCEDMDLELLEREDVTAHEISLALERVRSGTFGTCVSCGRSIARARLDVLPWTRTCIRCAPEDGA